jgi:transposase
LPRKAKPIAGAPPKPDAKQTAKLARIVRSGNPLQLNLEFALWTMATIRELIRGEFDASLSEASVGRLMRRLGFSPAPAVPGLAAGSPPGRALARAAG